MDPVSAALSLSYHLPTASINDSINHMCTINPEITCELLSEIDRPLSLIVPENSNGNFTDPFVVSDYNREGEFYRSPFKVGSTPSSFVGGEYYSLDGTENKEIATATLPIYLLQIENFANEVFKTYVSQYFTQGTTIPSIYCWEKNVYNEGDEIIEVTDNGDGKTRMNHFGMAVMFHKASDQELRKQNENIKANEDDLWDGVHLISVDFVSENQAAKTITYKYSINSTVVTYLFIEGEGRLQLAGKVAKQKEFTVVHNISKLNRSIIEQHVTAAIGPQIEEIETELLNYINDIYFSGTGDVLTKLRTIETLEERTRRERDSNSIANDLKIRNAFLQKVLSNQSNTN